MSKWTDAKQEHIEKRMRELVVQNDKLESDIFIYKIILCIVSISFIVYMVAS